MALPGELQLDPAALELIPNPRAAKKTILDIAERDSGLPVLYTVLYLRELFCKRNFVL